MTALQALADAGLEPVIGQASEGKQQAMLRVVRTSPLRTIWYQEGIDIAFDCTYQLQPCTVWREEVNLLAI